MGTLPKHLFSLPLTIEPDPIVEKLPRRFGEEFEFASAKLGDIDQGFLIAIARTRPTILASRSLVRAISKTDNTRRTVIFSPEIDSGMMRGLASEGIAYIRDANNVFLPFLGMAISPTPQVRMPAALSPHAQRIVLNVIAGRWDGFTAGELSAAAEVSRATISKCLAEIEAILPSMLITEWKRRLIRNPGLSKGELLDAFEPYFSSPIRGRKLLVGALLSGESALPFFSDLAQDAKVIRVAVHRKQMGELIARMRDNWVEAAWFEEPTIIVEEWAYRIDGCDPSSRTATGFDSLDALSLYVAMKDERSDDVRLADAIAQLREAACR